MDVDTFVRITNRQKLLTCAILIAGCSSESGYKVTGARSHFDKEQDFGRGGQMVEFTLEHQGSVIKARCQAWDIKNHCDLEVGKTYDMERSRGVPDMLWLFDDAEKKKDRATRNARTVLLVEEEKTGR